MQGQAQHKAVDLLAGASGDERCQQGVGRTGRPEASASFMTVGRSSSTQRHLLTHPLEIKVIRPVHPVVLKGLARLND